MVQLGDFECHELQFKMLIEEENTGVGMPELCT